DRAGAAAADLPQLVPPPLSIRLRELPMREEHKLAAAPVRERQHALAQFAADVHYYLSLQPRQLPSHYLYDALGSALFDAICRLPWYRITRAEMRLLTAHGRAIFARVPRLSTVVELGSGSGEKLTALVDAGRPPQMTLDAHLIDVSGAALAAATQALTA